MEQSVVMWLGSAGWGQSMKQAAETDTLGNLELFPQPASYCHSLIKTVRVWYMYMHSCLFTWGYSCIHARDTSIHAWVHIHTCIRVCVYKGIHVFMFGTQAHKYSCLCTHSHMYSCLCTQGHSCIHARDTSTQKLTFTFTHAFLLV